MSCDGRKRRIWQVGLLSLPVLGLLAWLFLTPLLLEWAAAFPRCPVKKLTGLLCPACGNTHCVMAMLKLDLLTALRANLFFPCLGVFLLAGYVELVMRAFGRPVRLLPRRPAFYWCALGFFLLYWILRNFPAFDFLRL